MALPPKVQVQFYVPRPIYESFHKLFPEREAKSLVLRQLVGLCVSLGKGHKFIDSLRDMIERKYE